MLGEGYLHDWCMTVTGKTIEKTKKSVKGKIDNKVIVFQIQLENWSHSNLKRKW